MSDAATRTTHLLHTSARHPVEIVIQRDWLEAAVVVAGCAVVALAGVLLASYFALPFGS